MSRLLLYLSALSLCLTACERLVPSPNQSDYFIKLYGGRFLDQGQDVLAVPGSQDYLILGTSLSFNAQDADLLLMRTDSLGNELFGVGIGGQANDRASKMAPLPSGNGLVVGGTSDDGQKDALVARLSWNLDLAWQVSVGSDLGDETLSQLIATADGGILLVGSTTQIDTAKNDWDGNQAFDDSDIWIVKLSETGQVLWEKKYGFGGSDHGVAVRELNKQYHILATTDYLQNIPGDEEVLLIRLNENGNILDQQVIEIDGQDDRAADLALLPDGDWMVLSSFQVNGDPNSQLQLLRVGAKLDQYERFALSGGELTGHLEARFLELLPGGEGLAISAIRRSFALGNGDMVLVRTDLTGKLNWAASFGSSGDDACGGLVWTGEESFLLSGTIDYENDNSMVCLIKTQLNNQGEVLP
jgi:hypothetical protein